MRIKGIGRGLPVGSRDKRKLLIIAAAALALLLLIWSGVKWIAGEKPYWGRKPAEIVTAALDSVSAAGSYTYTLETCLVENDKEERLAVFSGAKSGRDSQVVGELDFLKTTVEIVWKDEKLYRKDHSEDRWVELPLLTLDSLDKLMVEIKPLTIFSFADTAEAKYAGKKKEAGKTCRVYEMMSLGEHPWLIDYWEDFNFRLWVDQKTGTLVKGEIRASQPGNGARGIVVRLLVDNIDKPIRIEAPVQQ